MVTVAMAAVLPSSHIEALRTELLSPLRRFIAGGDSAMAMHEALVVRSQSVALRCCIMRSLLEALTAYRDGVAGEFEGLAVLLSGFRWV
jgi:hypothetical protein